MLHSKCGLTKKNKEKGGGCSFSYLSIKSNILSVPIITRILFLEENSHNSLNLSSLYYCSVFLVEINYEMLLKEWKNVAVFHSLALLLGPLIESVALIDKYMFLHESGTGSLWTFIFGNTRVILDLTGSRIFYKCIF